MKITKIAQWGKPVSKAPADTQQTPQTPETPAQVTQDFSKAVNLSPKIANDVKQILARSGMSKQKLMPILDQLFTALGDVPLSQIKNLINSLTEN